MFPDAARYRAWKNVFDQKINTAFGRPDDKAFIRARPVEDESISDEDLRVVPRKFAILSRKIAATLQEKATGQVGRIITQTAGNWIKEGKSVPGLLLLRIIVKYFATGRAADALFNITICNES